MVSKTSVEGTVNYSKNPEKFPGVKEKTSESKGAKDELKEAEKMQKAHNAEKKDLRDKLKAANDKLKEAEENAKKGGFKLFGGK